MRSKEFDAWYPEVVAKIAALDNSNVPDHPDLDPMAYVPKVVEIFRGSPAEWFHEIDRLIASAHPDFSARGYMVRRVRNRAGKELFAAMAQGDKSATASAVKRMRPMSWGDFKAKLQRKGIISYGDDVPVQWRIAFCAAFGRAYPNK